MLLHLECVGSWCYRPGRGDAAEPFFSNIRFRRPDMLAGLPKTFPFFLAAWYVAACRRGAKVEVCRRVAEVEACRRVAGFLLPTALRGASVGPAAEKRRSWTASRRVP